MTTARSNVVEAINVLTTAIVARHDAAPDAPEERARLAAVRQAVAHYTAKALPLREIEPYEKAAAIAAVDLVDTMTESIYGKK